MLFVVRRTGFLLPLLLVIRCIVGLRLSLSAQRILRRPILPIINNLKNCSGCLGAANNDGNNLIFILSIRFIRFPFLGLIHFLRAIEATPTVVPCELTWKAGNDFAPSAANGSKSKLVIDNLELGKLSPI
jgi:hypothetical protein